jgi:hypothetical protein
LIHLITCLAVKGIASIADTNLMIGLELVTPVASVTDVRLTFVTADLDVLFRIVVVVVVVTVVVVVLSITGTLASAVVTRHLVPVSLLLLQSLDLGHALDLSMTMQTSFVFLIVVFLRPRRRRERRRDGCHLGLFGLPELPHGVRVGGEGGQGHAELGGEVGCHFGGGFGRREHGGGVGFDGEGGMLEMLREGGFGWTKGVGVRGVRGWGGCWFLLGSRRCCFVDGVIVRDRIW